MQPKQTVYVNVSAPKLIHQHSEEHLYKEKKGLPRGAEKTKIRKGRGGRVKIRAKIPSSPHQEGSR